MLQASWQAPDGGDLQAEAGATQAVWIPRTEGEQRVVLVVSDGERRFAQDVRLQVGEGEETPTPSPLATFAPSGSATPTPTGSPSGAFRVDVGKRADGDDEDGIYSNGEIVSPGSDVTYVVTIDNDADVPVTVISLIDDTYDDIVCETGNGGDVVGAVLAPDDGDAEAGPGSFDQGADEIQCTFVVPAPDDSGVTVTDVVRVTVEDDDGASASDFDDATITTS
jgi:hypothetical protein